MSLFHWTEKKSKAALVLAQGYTIDEAAERAGVDPRTVDRWKTNAEFEAEVDRLSLMVDIAGRSERLRIAMRVVREKIGNETIKTEKDLLDWLKFAQSETDGIKLDLASLLEAATSVAGSGPDRPAAAPDGADRKA